MDVLSQDAIERSYRSFLRSVPRSRSVASRNFREYAPLDSTEVEDLVLRSLMSLDTAYSLKVALIYRYEPSSLAKILMPDPLHYNDAHLFSLDLQAFSLLRKSVGFVPDGFTREESVRKLIAMEDQCASTNLNIRQARAGRNPALYSLLQRARNHASRILGRFSITEHSDSCSWGPGATSTLPRSMASVQEKCLERDLSVTPCALPYLTHALSGDPHWLYARGSPFENDTATVSVSLSSSRGTFVPKDYRSERFIAIEPTGNLFLQKGIGSMMKRRLARAGIDLSDQTRNQARAYVGSKYGTLATLDLSSASDSISYQLVKEILPDDWFKICDRIRSLSISLPELDLFRLEKFSSMGNGFTFELESLVFYCIGLSCCSHKESLLVYGDDLVCHTEDVEPFTTALESCGFTINREKSFSSSAYRESCGKHFFSGCDVTPVFIRDFPRSLPQHIRFINRLLSISTSLYDEKLTRRVLSKAPPFASVLELGLDTGVRIPYSLLRTALPSGKSGF